MNNNSIKVAAFYMFTNLTNLEELQKQFSKFLKNANISGTILLANEGINGTVAGSISGIDNFKNFLSLHKLFSHRIIKPLHAKRILFLV